MKNTNESYGLEKQSNALSADIREKRKKYKRQRKIKAGSIIAASVAVVIVIALLIVAFMKTDVKDEIIIEAGSKMVQASDFFENPEEISAQFFMYDEVDTRLPGTYNLKIRNGIIIYNVKLKVEDTVAPQGEVKAIGMKLGETLVSPDVFVINVTDETEVKVSFKNNVVFTQPGDTDVVIVLTDAGGNQTEYTTRLTIYPEALNPSLELEAGAESISVSDFLAEGTEIGENDKILTEEADINLKKVGKTNLQLLFGNTVYTVTLKIKDTKKPTAYIINKETYQGKEIPASDFVRTVYDETQVEISYKKEPDFKKTGSQTITIILIDEGGNESEYKATLYVNKDTSAPVITAYDRTVYIGDNIRFTQDVTVKDNNDDDIEIRVDTDGFDKTKPGRYPVTFSAKDSSGNKAKKTVYFTLKEKVSEKVSQGVIDSAFVKLYDRIIDDDMTQTEKCRAIYDYIRKNIAYTGTSDKTDSEQEAYRGINTKGGDSFTYYSVARKLLTMADIDNKGLERANSDTSHYWNLVEIDGIWYHFDTCPHYKDYPLDSFLLTDEEVKEYSEKTNGYYDYGTN